MGLFNKLFNRKVNQPEDQYTVTITTEWVKVEHPKWGVETLIWTDLQKVFYINTDEGPWLPDLWLTLVGNNSSCRIPLGAKGFEEVYDIVSKYPEFDFENANKAISCTANAEFLLWTNQLQSRPNSIPMSTEIMEGQIWSYITRKGEEESRLTILKVEQLHNNTSVAHIRIDGLNLHQGQVQTNYSLASIEHLPISLTALTGSLVKLELTVEVSVNEGYFYWKSQFLEGKAGVWDISVLEAIDITDRAYT